VVFSGKLRKTINWGHMVENGIPRHFDGMRGPIGRGNLMKVHRSWCLGGKGNRVKKTPLHDSHDNPLRCWQEAKRGENKAAWRQDKRVDEI